MSAAAPEAPPKGYKVPIETASSGSLLRILSVFGRAASRQTTRSRRARPTTIIRVWTGHHEDPRRPPEICAEIVSVLCEMDAKLLPAIRQ
jgi:hypothetical protein